MTQQDFFKNAKWVGAAERTENTFSVLRGQFYIDDVQKVNLNVLGLGFFKCYINGECINPDTFLPLSSDFEGSCDPTDEVLSAHRIYVPQFDITPFVKTGENTIDVHFGGGWYTFPYRAFGLPKAIYCIESGTDCFVSDKSCKIKSGLVYEYNFTKFEKQDYTIYEQDNWQDAVETEALETVYCTTDCPVDKLIQKLDIQKVGQGSVYDCGENTTGYPVLHINAPAGETVCVTFSEELMPDGTLDMTHSHSQQFTVVSDGKEREVQPEFTWFGFRYFEVSGSATPKCVKVVHADVPVSSSFECDNQTLNWTYKTFVHTMLCNMHTGHPTDCPHIERRGYTGDGQLTCNAALSVFDGREFYEKWLQDIADGQDKISGHIQYTAPYTRSGGGPGGWGSAIVEVPYQLYMHYGDKKILEKYYENMRRYIDYLEAHSEFCLVTSDKKGSWCLGDWCGPNILYADKGISSRKGSQQVIIPAPMVNTYFMVKSLNQMMKIARIIGKEQDIAEYEKKAEQRKKAIYAAYFNAVDNNFIMNVQGANAFAVDIGLGNDITYENMVDYYQKIGQYDTGIFATDILTRLLFERGNADLAVELMSGSGEQSFEHWRQNGATTFHEYWDSSRSRSHNHHMFGAPVAYLFEYLLGIKQQKDTAGYSSLVIEPQAVSKFGYMSGSMNTPNGKVAVSYKHTCGAVKFLVTIPENTKAVFKYNEIEKELCKGENIIEI